MGCYTCFEVLSIDRVLSQIAEVENKRTRDRLLKLEIDLHQKEIENLCAFDQANFTYLKEKEKRQSLETYETELALFNSRKISYHSLSDSLSTQCNALQAHKDPLSGYTPLPNNVQDFLARGVTKDLVQQNIDKVMSLSCLSPNIEDRQFYYKHEELITLPVLLREYRYYRSNQLGDPGKTFKPGLKYVSLERRLLIDLEVDFLKRNSVLPMRFMNSTHWSKPRQEKIKSMISYIRKKSLMGETLKSSDKPFIKVS